MAHWRFVVRSTLVLAASVVAAFPAVATTLVRQGLDQLVDDNELVVQARVLELHSYWTADHSFILTDVRVRPSQVFKGNTGGEGRDVTLTVMGGTVGDKTIVLVGGPDLATGSEYVLFLTRDQLPGAADRLTVRDQAQGVFEVDRGMAFSQAISEPLLPDVTGRTDVPGGEQGVPLDQLIRLIHGHLDR